jgi:hypothetical protein
LLQRLASPRRHVAARTDLCLVVPPFDSVHFPALGVSVLASAVQSRGLSVRTV